jgi:phage anti-repressor protein
MKCEVIFLCTFLKPHSIPSFDENSDYIKVEEEGRENEGMIGRERKVD